MRKSIKLAFVLVVILTAVYVLKGVELYFNQAAHVFHPKPGWTATPRELGLVYEDIRFKAKDGVELSGWFLPAKQAQVTVLFCHGNANNISSEKGAMNLFHGMGFDAFLFDYRGYGKSQNARLTEQSTALDAEAAWDYLVNEKKLKPSQIIVWGRSLGGAIAVHLAAERQPKLLVMEASFTSLGDLAEKLYPYFPIRPILRFRYDNLESMRQVRCPVLIVHSRDDLLVPFSHGKRLFEAAPFPKEFLEIRGPHTGVSDEDLPQYKRDVEKLLKRLLIQRSR